MAAYRRVMTHVTCRLTAKNRDQLRNPTLVIEYGLPLPFLKESEVNEAWLTRRRRREQLAERAPVGRSCAVVESGARSSHVDATFDPLATLSRSARPIVVDAAVCGERRQRCRAMRQRPRRPTSSGSTTVRNRFVLLYTEFLCV